MALRERNDCTDEGLVPRALAIHSSLLSSSTQRWMSSVNFLSETLLFIATRPTARYFAGSRLRRWLRPPLRHPSLGVGVLRLYPSSLQQGSIYRGQAPTQRRSMA